jgi:cell division septum initiation protein DivIVA
MSKGVADRSPRGNGPVKPDPGVTTDAWKLLTRVTPSQLRGGPLPRRLVGGYSTAHVDGLLERAAWTIDDLEDAVRTLGREVDELRRRTVTADTPESVVDRMLTTAQEVIEQVKQEALQDADRIRAEARHEATRAKHLRLEAQAAIEAARAEAATLLETAQEERRRLVAGSLGEVAQARAELEAEQARVSAAMNDLRGAWAGRIGDALAHLDTVGLDTADRTAGEPAAGPPAPAHSAPYSPPPAAPHSPPPARPAGPAPEPPPAPTVTLDSSRETPRVEEEHFPGLPGAEVLAELRRRLAAADESRERSNGA